MKANAIFLFSMAVMVSACSNQQIYNTVQQNNAVECGKLPQSQYEQCMSEIDQPYEEYERERQVLEES